MRNDVAVSLVVCALLASSHTALAQDSASDAKKAVEEARAAFKRGDFRGCLESLERAQQVAPNPHLFWNMAACEKKLGKVAHAIDHVERFLAAGSALKGSERRDAEAFIEAARAFVSRVNVSANVDGVEIFIDDELVATTPLPKPIVVDEGAHRVRFVRSGYKTIERDERAIGGASLVWAVELSRDVEDSKPPPPSPPPSPSPPPPPDIKREAPSRSLGLGPVILGATGAVVAAGGIFFVLSASSNADRVEGECAPSCPPSRWEKYRDMQIAGDVMIGVGGAAVVSAIVWQLFLPRKNESAAWIAPTFGGLNVGGRLP